MDVWAWSTYGVHYPGYCKLAQEFRCDPTYAAHGALGEIDANWHPLGFSERVQAVKEPCGKEADDKFCHGPGIDLAVARALLRRPDLRRAASCFETRASRAPQHKACLLTLRRAKGPSRG